MNFGEKNTNFSKFGNTTFSKFGGIFRENSCAILIKLFLLIIPHNIKHWFMAFGWKEHKISRNFREKNKNSGKFCDLGGKGHEISWNFVEKNTTFSKFGGISGKLWGKKPHKFCDFVKKNKKNMKFHQISGKST